MEQEVPLTRAHLKTPRAAAVAGIAFSILLIISLVLIRISVPANPQDAGTWLSGGWKPVSLALHLLPFAGIAFLWFIGVLRDRLGVREDRFFATVFFGSGILFVAMIFVSAALADTVIMCYKTLPGRLIESGIYTFARTMCYEISTIYALRMAGVFMMTTCTVAIRIAIFPRWMAFLGYLLALGLLLSAGVLYWSPLVFPLWTLMISAYILLANLRPGVAH